MNYFYKNFLYFFLLLIIFFASSSSYAQIEGIFGTHNLLLGKTGVAHDQAKISSLVYNPAHIAEIDRFGLNLASGISYYKYTYRYIGDISRSSSNLDIAGIPLPIVTYPITRGLILGGFIIPFPVKTKIKAKKLPLGLLGQLNFADLNGTAKLNMYIDLYSSILRTSFLSIGTNVSYISYQADVGVNAAGYLGNNIVDVHLESSILSLKLGTKIKFSPRLYMGLYSTLFYSNPTSTSITTVLDPDNDNDGTPDRRTPTKIKSNIPVKNVRVGLSFKLSPNFIIYADTEYSKESVSKQLSLVDFIEKEKDTANTLSSYVGSEFILSSDYQILAGFYYEPSAIGKGSTGKNGKVGFGFMDLAMGLGAPPSRPVWGAGAGIRAGFMKAHKKRYYNVFERHNSDFDLTIDLGVVYSNTSIGVPKSGEQPASYNVHRIDVPIELSYMF